VPANCGACDTDLSGRVVTRSRSAGCVASEYEFALRRLRGDAADLDCRSERPPYCSPVALNLPVIMHRFFPIAAIGLVLSAQVCAQTSAGTITGSVSDPEGHPVSMFPVQAANIVTKAEFSARPSATGEYKLGPLPAGTYTVQIQAPLIFFRPFVRENILVPSGRTVNLNIQLAEGVALNTAGDGRDFFTDAARNRPPAPKGPTPRGTDGKPDFSGLWLGENTVDSGKPEMTPSAKAILQERIDNNLRDFPQARCLPLGIVLAGMFGPNRIVHTPKLIVIVYENSGPPGYRQIPIDGRKLPAAPDPTWMGYSSAHWEGDTLVVESAGFNDKTWLEDTGRPHTEQMRVTERIRRPDLGHREIEITIDDPGAYLSPWTIKKVAQLAPPGEDIIESICTENNRDVEHLVGK
jgi:hypothetical protein